MQIRCEFDFTKVKSNNLKITVYCSCSWSYRHNDISHVESFETALFEDTQQILYDISSRNSTQIDVNPCELLILISDTEIQRQSNFIPVKYGYGFVGAQN